MAEAVVDASAIVDLLLDNALGAAVRRRIAGHVLLAPAHIDAEVLSALGRLHRAGELEAESVESRLRELAEAPIQLRLVDALYVELAVSRGLPLVTTDRRLHVAPSADVVVT